MNAANPIWRASRIHGELLKLGIEISQATVAKHMVRRRGTSSNLAQLSPQSGCRHRCDRPVRRGVRFVSAPLCDDHSGARSQEDCAL
jgi:hypothetical protein